METFYFTNKRGFNYVMLPETEWKKSGYLPRFSGWLLPFTDSNPNTIFPPNVERPGSATMSDGYNDNAISSSYVSSFIFNGATKTAMWYYFSEDDADKQLSYLRSVGINSIRVFLDMYCWAGFREKFLDRLSKFSKICDKYKIYTEYVLFDGISVTKLKNPQTINEGISLGLCYWQQCPGVNDGIYGLMSPAMITFHPSAMVVSGDYYLEDIYRTVSGYQSTHLFDIVNESPNPNDSPQVSGFITSATNKMRSLLNAGPKKNKHKLTIGFAALYALSAQPFGYPFKETIEGYVQLLDVLSLHAYGRSYFDKYVGFRTDVPELAVSSGKPIVANESARTEVFNRYADDLAGFNKLSFGFAAWDAMVDRPLGAEPFLQNYGIFFADGQVRKLKDVEVIRDITLDQGWLKRKQLNFNIKEKVASTDGGLDGGYSRDWVFSKVLPTLNSTDNTALYKYPYAGIVGVRAINNALLARDIYNNPVTVSAATNFTPYTDSPYSRSPNYNWNSENYIGAIDYLYSAINFSALTPLSSITNEADRDLNYQQRIYMLRELDGAFGMTVSKLGDLAYNTKYDYKLLSDATATELSSVRAKFYPYYISTMTTITNTSTVDATLGIRVDGDYNKSYYVCSALQERKGFSVTPVNSAYGLALSSYNKPTCFYARGGGAASGHCYYKAGASIDTSLYTSQNIYSALDWARYDLELNNYAKCIVKAAKEYISNLEKGNFPDLRVGRIPKSYIDKSKPKSFYPLEF